MNKLYDLYYWNKHQYEWVWIGMSQGRDKHQAIRKAKADLPEIVARGDVMKVEEYNVKSTV